MIVVSDTSAITALLQIGRAELLEKLYRKILIPEAVRAELLQSHSVLPVFLHCEPVVNLQAVQNLLREIEQGEAEAIVLAQEQHADVLLIDELAGRHVAHREGIPYIGLLGVLVQAKQHHLITSVRETTQQLETVAGFHLSEEIKSVALRKAGEL